MATEPNMPIRYFGNYLLLGKLGEGGMGEVWHAIQENLNREVAIKVIRTGAMATAEAIQRFRIEAEAVARLSHEHIVKILENGQHDGQHFFSMEWIDGASLAEQIKRGDWRMDPANSVELQRRMAPLIALIARAVHHAHQHRVIHRDIKPSNILLDQQNKPYLSDFGLARLLDADSGVSRTGAVLGTPSYMSPEQAIGDIRNITTATDIYGLGAVLYELLCGQPPFSGENSLRVLQQVASRKPISPGVSLKSRGAKIRIDPDLQTICMKCLENDAGNRYASGDALAEDLERWLRNEPVVARPTGPVERSWKWAKRHPVVAGLSVALVGAVALGLAATTWQWQRADAERVKTARANFTLRLERAEDYFSIEKAPLALVTLASILRDDPHNRLAQERLVNALNSRGFLVPSDHTGPEPTPVISSAALQLSLRTATSRDGNWRATATNESSWRIELWSLSGAQHVTMDTPPTNVIRCLRFSPDGRRLISASSDGTARIFDAEVGILRQSAVLPHTAAVHYGEFHPTRNWVITAAMDGGVRIWDLTSTQVVARIDHRAGCGAAVFGPDGTTVATGTEEGVVQLWSIEQSALSPKSDPFAFSTHGAIWGLSLSATDLFVTLGDGTRRGLSWTHKASRTPRAGSPGIRTPPDPSAALRASNSLVSAVVGSANFLCTDVSHDGQFIAIGDASGTARVWDIGRRQSLTPRLEHQGIVNSVRFSPDGLRLATSTPGGLSRVWDAQTGQPLTDWLLFTKPLVRVGFSTDGTRVEKPDGEAWDIHVGNGPAPTWLMELAEVIASVDINSPQSMIGSSLGEFRRRLLEGNEAGSWRPWVKRLLDGP